MADRVLGIRFTDAQYELVKSEAQKRNMNVSQYCRIALLATSTKADVKAIEKLEKIRKILSDDVKQDVLQETPKKTKTVKQKKEKKKTEKEENVKQDVLQEKPKKITKKKVNKKTKKENEDVITEGKS